MSDIVTKHYGIKTGDITDGLRELIEEARMPGLYTPDERRQFSSHWIGVLSPVRLEELLDEIERLRHPKIVVGSRELWEAMGLVVARSDALEEAAKVAEDFYPNQTYGISIAAAIRALKEK